jgi:non-ribosomal peptide synthetase component F
MLIEGQPLASPCAPLSDLLAAGLATPEAVALVSVDRSLTWGELEASSSRLAAGYLRLGLEPGDRIASLMPNRIDLLVRRLPCGDAAQPDRQDRPGRAEADGGGPPPPARAGLRRPQAAPPAT